MQASNSRPSSNDSNIKGFPERSAPAKARNRRPPASEKVKVEISGGQMLWIGIIGTALIWSVSKIGLKRVMNGLGFLSTASAVIWPLVKSLNQGVEK